MNGHPGGQPMETTVAPISTGVSYPSDVSPDDYGIRDFFPIRTVNHYEIWKRRIPRPGLKGYLVVLPGAFTKSMTIKKAFSNFRQSLRYCEEFE